MRPFPIEPSLRDYAWGTRDFIPEALGLTAGEQPVAEAWFGAHEAAPSVAHLDGGNTPLDVVVQRHAATLLGERVLGRFGRLPFLLKLLSAARPLSIQVHPSKAQAESGLLRESHAPGKLKSYSDDNHKPELLVALTPFYALCGFRDHRAISRHLEALPELARALPSLGDDVASLRALVEGFFALPDSVASAALRAWVTRLGEEHFGVDDWRHWAVEAHRTFSPPGGADRGLFFFALLNFVVLKPGEGLFLPAGVPHAYLSGSGLEVMASSDNVLRGGLTSKPIDVPELLRVTRFEPRPPWLVAEQTVAPGEVAYMTAAGEFELSRLSLAEGDSLTRHSEGPEILFVESGEVRLETSGEPLLLKRGASSFVPSGTRYGVVAAAAARVTRVAVPSPQPPKFRGRTPKELAFGTSGLRGLVTDITDLEAYVNTRGFLDFLVECGDAEPGASLALGGDLRPSTDGPDGSILRAVVAAARDSGFVPHYLGRLPTPALMSFAVRRGWPSIMVTGSHIPFDRNGIKFNRSTGEVLKADEAPILARVAEVRRREYLTPASASKFDDAGKLRVLPELPPALSSSLGEYLERYRRFFPADALAGLRVGVYQHSAVGRDFLVRLLESFGAKVHPFGRSQSFVAIDTEAITEERLQQLQTQVDTLVEKVGPLHAVVSTDGDSDRPLLLTLNAAGRLTFQSGDRLGIVTALACSPEAICVPVSATDAIETVFAPRGVDVVRTKIGSPFVIAAMAASTKARRVGWEANGGFLLGSDVVADGRPLPALPTRDAMLPILAVLSAARGLGENPDVNLVFAKLPSRFTHSALLDDVPPEQTRQIMDWCSPESCEVLSVELEAGRPVRASGLDGAPLALDDASRSELERVAAELGRHFPSDQGFGELVLIDYTDGIRMRFGNGDVAHVRASGNAPQLRIYAIAGTPDRAKEIAVRGTATGGTLTQLIASAKEGLRVRAIRANIAHTEELFKQRAAAALLGCVSGSGPAQRFWQRRLEDAQRRWGAQAVVALHEDLPVNQAFGVLLAWQRLRAQVVSGSGALVSFVFGEGTRASPFTETDNGQKPAMLSFVRSFDGDTRYVPMAELALRYFAPVEAHLRRSGFDGLVIKWGDEVQIPSRSLAGENPLFAGADVVRFVSLREIDEDDARNKDWVGVDARGRVTTFIPRRPLAEMERLADRGLLRREGSRLIGGVNLGSIAISARLLNALLAEFGADVNDATKDRKNRPDLDPQFFTALTIACIDDDKAREEAWQTAQGESASLGELRSKMPDLLSRLRSVVAALQSSGAPPRIVAMDFGEPYWGDIGQHRQIREFYQALLDEGPTGTISRALAGIGDARDAQGNLLVNSRLPANSRVRDSVLIDCEITGECEVSNSVLIGTRCRDLCSQGGFDVDSCVGALELAKNAGTYRVVDPGRVTVGENRRLTSVFLADGEPPVQLGIAEDTDLRQRARFYDVPLEGNALSLGAAHDAACATDPEALARRRSAAVGRVREAIDR